MAPDLCDSSILLAAMLFLKHEKPLIRRTFLQERFLILIKKQEDGSATFAELTELDEIINRDPKLTNIILEEMAGSDTPSKTGENDSFLMLKPAKNDSFWHKTATFLSNLLRFSIPFAGAV